MAFIALRAPPAPFPTRPDLVDPSGEIGVWLCEPPGAIVQFGRPSHGTRAHAEWLHGAATRALSGRFPGATSRFVVVLDLRLMTSRDISARELMLERMRGAPRPHLRAYVLLPENASAIYVTSVQSAVMLLRVMGVPVEVASSLDDLVRDHALRPAGLSAP